MAHVDHGLRMKSKSDAAFVEKLAVKNGLEFFGMQLEKPEKGENIEAWGRKERYKFFKSVSEKFKFDWVLTAHTANDVAETFLMRLLSNKELNSIEYVDIERKLLRPFLTVSTQEVYKYIRSNKLKFVEDETNKDDKFLRNKIRNKLLPILSKEFDKRITETLSERARDIQEDMKGMNSMFARPLLMINTYDFGSKEWLRAVKVEVEKIPEVLGWRLAESLFRPKLGFNLGRTKSKELLKFLKGELQGVQLPGGISIKPKASGISITAHGK